MHTQHMMLTKILEAGKSIYRILINTYEDVYPLLTTKKGGQL